MAKHIFSGSGAPGTTPTGIGHHYIDTDNGDSYISVGTSSSADWKITNDTVANDSISNAQLANVATQTIKGRATAGTGDPEDLTGTQATAILDNFVGDSGSGGTKGLVPAPSTGDATKFLKGDGSWDDVIDLTVSSLAAGVLDTDLTSVSGSDDTIPSALAVKTLADTKSTVSSDSGAPASTPTKVGDIYVDTSAGDVYFATGTSSSADWKKRYTAANDTIWDAKGDLAVATGADAASKLTVGSNNQVLSADSAQSTGLAWVTLNYREKLTANRTYYVRTDGSDSNNGLTNTSGGAFLTIQKGINTVRDLDLNGYIGTVRVGSGTYTEALTLPNLVGGTAQLLGDTTTPTNVIISAAGTCLSATDSRGWTIRGFQLTTSSGTGRGIVVNNGRVTIGDLDFGSMTGTAYHIYAVHHGYVGVTTNYTISAGVSRHVRVESFALVKNFSPTITLTGTPAFTYFAEAVIGGTYSCTPTTFSGSATGTRYNAAQNGLIYTNGGGATFLPGDVAGTTATQGQYI